MHLVQRQLNIIFANYEKEAKGLGVAFRVIFENESALPPDCFDAISDHVSSKDITKVGSAKVREWIIGMMSQFDCDPEGYAEFIDEDLHDFMELHKNLSE